MAVIRQWNKSLCLIFVGKHIVCINSEEGAVSGIVDMSWNRTAKERNCRCCGEEQRTGDKASIGYGGLANTCMWLSRRKGFEKDFNEMHQFGTEKGTCKQVKMAELCFPKKKKKRREGG